MKRKPNPIDIEVEHVLETLKTLDPQSKEYAAASDSLQVLCKARAEKPWWNIGPEVFFSGTVSLITVFSMLHYENAHVITSKALGWVKKML